ncbi:head-tail joining protein [Crenalkalicoccus roseus]|uniref:head-tail joining protein n=1 Tax=Crenalkalicoccus roseus TaxID=1485588 RepID=UPI00107FD681|nr:hypothetical protein [Crenalkalicoccus roseus]
MSDAFSMAALALAADPHLGAAAIYAPEGEAPMPVRVVLSREEGDVLGGPAGLIAAGYTAMLPAAAVPDRPRRGERLSVGMRDFIIETAELDSAGAAWRLTLRAA